MERFIKILEQIRSIAEGANLSVGPDNPEELAAQKSTIAATRTKMPERLMKTAVKQTTFQIFCVT